jgi:flagellar hook-basal body complex protein FliE
MSTTILPLRSSGQIPIEPLASIKPGGAGSSPSSFADLISSGIDTVERASAGATNAAKAFLSGENEDLHTVAIAQQKAEITSDLFMQLRNKAISAYQEVMKMQL